jgi:transposase
VEYLNTLCPSTLYYIDESGIEHGLYSTHGWSLRGEKIYANVPGSHRERTNIISASQNGKLVAPWVYEKSCTSDLVNVWLKECLLPAIPRGSVLIFDNASFHKSPLTRKLIEDAGCHLLFLPTYSPDLNPIEHIWFVLKSLLRKVLPDSSNPSDTICDYVSQCCVS